MTKPHAPAFDVQGLSLAFLVLRGWLGFRALFAGLDKFAATVVTTRPLLDAAGNEDASGAMVEVPQRVYHLANYHAMPVSLMGKLGNEPLLPHFLTTPFYAVLGFVLVALGLALLLGVFTRLTLLAMGVLYTLLTVGLILLGQQDGVAWLGIHAGLVAAALALSPYNRLTLTRP